jgi:phage RecT family recombinase
MSNIAETLQHKTLVERFEHSAPVHITHEKELGFAIQLLRGNAYLSKVADNDPNSLLSAMSNVAFIGLSLNPALKEAYLVPRKGKICLDPSYGGMIKLATDSGSIVWVQANLVYKEDHFTSNGPGEKPTHAHDPFSENRGEFVGVYCVAKTKEGDFLTTTMNRIEIHEIRDSSEGYKSGKGSPWNTHFGEMAKKTVIRRAYKTWPRSDKTDYELRLAAAVQISNDNEGIELPKTEPDLGSFSDDQKKYFDQIIETGNSVEMYTLQQTMPAREFTNLYHSFAKGTKGKYQRIVDDLMSKGREEFERYFEIWARAKYNGDDAAIAECKDELSESASELIESRL